MCQEVEIIALAVVSIHSHRLTKFTASWCRAGSVFPLAATPVLSSGGEGNCRASRGGPRIVAMPATSIHTMAVSVFSCQLRVWFTQKGAWGIVVLRGLRLGLGYHDDRGPGPMRAAILGSDGGTDHSTLTALHLQENRCGPADRGSSWRQEACSGERWLRAVREAPAWKDWLQC